MGRALLVVRLALRDLRRRRAEAALLVLAIMAATTTLTLGLVLHGVTDDPYLRTREATAGPDVVADVSPLPTGGVAADLAGLEALADAPGVVDHSGPFPVVGVDLEAGGQTAPAQAEGRDTTPAAVDQPKLTEGSWVEDGGVVVEAAFADALGVGAGDSITLDGRSFRVAGVAVTAAIASGVAPFYSPTWSADASPESPPVMGDAPGMVWLTQADARRLAPRAEAFSYVMNLKLADPADATAFADAHREDSEEGPVSPGDPGPPRLETWQEILDNASNLVRNERRALVTGSWLLGLLAVASVTVLVGGRMADQTRRVGLLKAVGGTPGLVAAVLLAEHVVVALLAATAGLTVGWLAAPLLTDPGAGLVGDAGAPSLTLSIAGLVTAAALAVAVGATLVPTVRAARTSTVRALAGSARPPRRTPWLIALSARLPVPLLVGLRVAARRPRRLVLGTVSIAVTVSGIVVVLAAHTQLDANRHPTASGFEELRADRLNDVLLVITVMLVALAAVNAVFITWATVLDARRSSALSRALGVTPNEVTAGLSAAQALPALAGAVLGIPGGLGLIAAVSSDAVPTPPLSWLLAVVPGTLLAVAALTTVPARIGARHPVAGVLQAELT